MKRKFAICAALMLLLAFGFISLAPFAANNDVEAKFIRIPIPGKVEFKDGLFMCIQDDSGQCHFDVWIVLPPPY